MMKDVSKTKKQLLEELAGLKGRIASLEKSLKECNNDKSTQNQSEISLYDVTGRKDQEKVPEESEEMFRVLAANSLIGMHIIQGGVFRFVNQATADICGFSIEEIKNWRPNEFARVIHPEDLPLIMQQVDKKQTGEKEFIANYSWRLITKSGDLKWIESYSTTIRFGEDYADFVMMIDVTNRKKVEEALRESEERFRSLSAAAFEAIVVHEGGILIRANDQYYKMFGYEPEELMGKQALMSTVAPETLESMKKNIAAGVLGPYESIGQKKDGTKFPIEIRVREIKYEGRKVRAAAIMDITERRAAEKALQEYRDHLEDLVKERTAELARSNADLEQFAYVASHDLQEPLRMVASFTQLLAKRYQGKLDADADEFIAFAVDGASRMQRLINDLLAYSRVTTRKNPFLRVECDKVLDSVINNLKLAIDESGAIIARDPLPAVMGDPLQVGQIFQNLITNAIKFRSDEPLQIHISADLKDTDWVFSFRDNGIGIDSDQYERIFVIFQRLLDKKGTPGTGIGLAICKKIVENHGGRIWVESRPGEGSVFYFTIPRLQEESPQKGPNDIVLTEGKSHGQHD
jgi:PAS domain S-box-containing protein